MYSLTRRVLATVFLTLACFLGLAALGLDALFRDLAGRSQRELLDAQMIALVAAAETDPAGRVVAVSALADSRLQMPASGLYARIATRDGGEIWRSPSFTGARLSIGTGPAGDAAIFGFERSGSGERLAVLRRAIRWQLEDGTRQELVFAVATGMAPYERQLRLFRTQLLAGFLALSVVLLATIAALLRRGLRPIGRLEGEIAAVEAGAARSLGTGYPRELAGVAASLNALLASERERIARHRTTLGDIAHSLKTPLAVIRGALEAQPAATAEVLRSQVARMNDIVERELRRAAATGGQVVGAAPVEVADVVQELRATLLRVHGRRDIAIRIDVPAGLQFLGERADLLEALGNLMDNACKWCRSDIVVSARLDAGVPGARLRLAIVVEDDGAGLPERILEDGPARGRRADEAVPGHGIGLAMVADTARLYGGALSFGASASGGARVQLSLPGRLGVDAPPASVR
jgi:two-component system sensor histidine kinase PhoQ